MAKKNENNGYKEITEIIASGNIGRLYILHGEEHFLLEHSVAALRKALCPDGLGSFNYRRFEGTGFSPDELSDAVNTLPAFAERTLIEIYDYDIFKAPEDQKQKIADIFEKLPDYVCLVLIFDTLVFKPDKRLKLNTRLLKTAEVIEFAVQDRRKLITWIQRRFKAYSLQISSSDAEYLAFVTGGFMTSLVGEIEKISSYTQNTIVSRKDIDAVAESVLDAVAYKLTDAVMNGDSKSAMRILDDLLRMREAPQKIIYGITLKMRHMLAARICIENGLGVDAFTELCSIRYAFQARAIMDAARKSTLDVCRHAVLACSETAFALNSAPEPESRLIELITRLALVKKAG